MSITLAAIMACTVPAQGTPPLKPTTSPFVDGDTLYLVCDAARTKPPRPINGGKPVKYRIDYIDAPAIRTASNGTPEQPWGREARAALVELCGRGQRVIARPTGTSSWGRPHITLSCTPPGATRRVDVGRRMVEQGHAWPAGVPAGSPLPALHAEAKAKGRGLWSLPEQPVPPWEWRSGGAK